MTHRRSIAATFALVALGAFAAHAVLAQTIPPPAAPPGGPGWSSSAAPAPGTSAGAVIAATQPGMVTPAPTDARLPQPDARRFLPDDGLRPDPRPPRLTGRDQPARA